MALRRQPWLRSAFRHLAAREPGGQLLHPGMSQKGGFLPYKGRSGMAGVDVKHPLQIVTANVASVKVSGPCPAASIGAVSAQSERWSPRRQTI